MKNVLHKIMIGILGPIAYALGYIKGFIKGLYDGLNNK